MEQARSPEATERPTKSTTPGLRKKSFSELFTVEELLLYGAAMVVYIVLGLLFKDKVLNVGVGPIFFVLWIWIVPPLFRRIRERLSGR